MEKEKMKILCCAFCYYDYTSQLANALSKKEDVMLVLMLPGRILREELDNLLDIVDETVKLQLFKEPKQRMYYPTYYLAYLSTIFEVVKQIKIFKPDVIHFQVGSSVELCIVSGFLKNYPIVITVHDPKIHVGQDRYLRAKLAQRYIVRHSNQIIVHGEKLKEQMIKIYNLPSNKVHAISIGEHEVAPFKKYEKKNIKEDENLILYFGTIVEYKGLEYLIEAEPMITKEVPDAKIAIAGKGKDFNKYEKMMINRNNFIVHNHYIPYKEGAELFQRCSVVALPYIEASQSGVVPTAYGFKKPVIVTDVGSIPEIVDDGVTGFIVPPKKPEALSEAIVKLLKDDKLRREMGENAYKKLKTELSWGKIAEKTIEVYEKAINDQKVG